MVEKLKLNAADYTIVNVEAPEMLAAIERGDIDGFAVWEPWPTRTLMTVKGTKILQTAEGIYNNINFVYMNRGWIEKNKATAEKFMLSLVQANDLIEKDRPAAASMVSKFLKMPLELATRADAQGRVRHDTGGPRSIESIQVSEKQLAATRRSSRRRSITRATSTWTCSKKVRPENVKITALPQVTFQGGWQAGRLTLTCRAERACSSCLQRCAAPAVTLDGVQEILDGRVEGGRLLEVHRVAGLRQLEHAAARDGALQEQARSCVDSSSSPAMISTGTGIGGKLRRALEERHAPALHAAHGHGVALGRAVGELLLELRPTARVLVAVLHARRAGAIELGHGRHALALDARGEAAHSSLNRCLAAGSVEAPLPAAAAVSDSAMLRMADGEFEAAVAPIDSPTSAPWRFEPADHCCGIVGGALLGVGIHGRRDVRRRPTARGVGDAAIAAREIAHLRLPAHIVAAELVQEKNSVSRAGLLVVELHTIIGRGQRHCVTFC